MQDLLLQHIIKVKGKFKCC